MQNGGWAYHSMIVAIDSKNSPKEKAILLRNAFGLWHMDSSHELIELGVQLNSQEVFVSSF